MVHYDGKEFEKMLQKAQANMMKGIPSLEAEDNPALPPAANVEQAKTQNLVESPSGKVVQKQHFYDAWAGLHDLFNWSVSDDSQSEHQLGKPAKKRVEKHPKPVMEKPAKPVLEKSSKTTIKTVATDSLSKQVVEKSNKSPPPPPPRKTFSSLTGMTTTRSGEVVYTSRKESVSAQVGLKLQLLI